MSEYLKTVDVPIVSQQKCENQYSFGSITSKMLCAGKQGKDACHVGH